MKIILQNIYLMPLPGEYIKKCKREFNSKRAWAVSTFLTSNFSSLTFGSWE